MGRGFVGIHVVVRSALEEAVLVKKVLLTRASVASSNNFSNNTASSNCPSQIHWTHQQCRFELVPPSSTIPQTLLVVCLSPQIQEALDSVSTHLPSRTVGPRRSGLFPQHFSHGIYSTVRPPRADKFPLDTPSS